MCLIIPADDQPLQVHLFSNLQSNTKPYYMYPHLKYQGL